MLVKCQTSFGLLVVWMVVFSSAGGTRAEAAAVTVVEALLGKTVALPCQAIEHPHRDSPVLLLFYKSSSNVPFYSYDAREEEVWRQGIPKISDSMYDNRVVLDMIQPRKVFLNLKKVRLEDEGHFTCRVDFLGSPSLTSIVDLRVYENPKDGPRVSVEEVDQGSREVTGSEVGPFYEGETIHLLCTVVGGYPTPLVTWWQDTVLLENSSKVVPGNPPRVVSDVTIGPLSRDRVRVPYTCRSENNPLTAPRDRTLHVKIHMAPESVLLPQNPTVRAWVEEGLECRAMGAYPEANISWALNGRPLNYTALETRQVGTDTVSWVRFVARPQDNGASISCKAMAPTLLSVPPLQAASIINVTHAPIVRLELGSNLRPDEIRQGDDVYFDCHNTANPPILKIGWYKNNVDVLHDKQKGVLVGGINLVLQTVQRSDAGNYSCSATNSVGTTHSAMLQLSVQYAPMCAQTRKTITAVEGDVQTLECRVDAHPPNVTFFWLFNNTVDSTRFRKSEYVSRGAVSTLRYVAYTARDYGAIYCWAQNVVATQSDPCAFTLQPAGSPDSVRDCVLTNQSAGSLHITCKPGADGGLTQSFRAEIFTRGADTPVRVLEGMVPVFTVEGLAPGGDYVVRVTALNKKGSSVPISLEAFTLKVAENRMISGVSTSSNPEDAHQPPEEKELSPLFGVVSGVIIVMALLSVFAIFATRRRHRCFGRSSRSPDIVAGQELDQTISSSTLSSLSQSNKLKTRHSASSCDDTRTGHQDHIETAPFLGSAVEPEGSSEAAERTGQGEVMSPVGSLGGPLGGVFTIPAHIPPPPQYCCSSTCSEHPVESTQGDDGHTQMHSHDHYQYPVAQRAAQPTPKAPLCRSPIPQGYASPTTGSSHPQIRAHPHYGTSRQGSPVGLPQGRVCSPLCGEAYVQPLHGVNSSPCQPHRGQGSPATHQWQPCNGATSGVEGESL